jgi:hypothetical protein
MHTKAVLIQPALWGIFHIAPLQFYCIVFTAMALEECWSMHPFLLMAIMLSHSPSQGLLGALLSPFPGNPRVFQAF